MNNHRILITGSNGLLGQKLVHLIKDREDLELLATSMDENRISDELGYEYKTLDITNFDDVMRVVSDFKPTAIINTAAMTQVDLCEDLREKCRLLNVGAIGYLIAASKTYNAHLIQISSDFVFDGKSGPYKEDDDPNPLSFYGQCKYDAEQLLINSGLNNWSIVRTIILYGVGEQLSRSNLVLWAMDRLQKGDSMRVVRDQFRAPTLAEDLAQGCLEIVLRKCNGIYHLSGPELRNIHEIVLLIGDYFGWDTSKVESIMSTDLDQQAKRPRVTGFVLDKAISNLDYQPRTLQEGLEIVANQLNSKAVS